MAIDHLTDDMLQEYIDGSPQNREELQAHLADCPQCREHLAEYKKLSGYLAIEPNFELSADFAHTVASAVEEDSTEKILFKLSRAVIWLVGIFACFFSVWYFSDKELIQDNIDKVEGSGQSAFDLTLKSFQNLFENIGLDVNLVFMVAVVIGAIVLVDRLVVHARRTATTSCFI